jgi:hypothetical protein
MRISLKFDSSQFKKTADRLIQGTSNFSPFLQNLIPLVEMYKEKQFASEGGVLSEGKWKPTKKKGGKKKKAEPADIGTVGVFLSALIKD